MSLLIYSLSVWFFFYLYNHAEITRPTRDWIVPRLPSPAAYMVQCSFCSTFYVTLVGVILVAVPTSYLLVAPVVNLFVELLYRKLKPSA